MKTLRSCSRAYDAFNAADIDTLTELFDEDVVWHLPGKSSMADDYQGRDATLAYFGQIGERTGGTFQAELQQLFAGRRRPGDRPPAQHRVSETASAWM